MEKISLVEIKLIGLSLGRKTTNENGQSAIDCGSHWQKFEAGKYAERIPNKINDKIFAVSNPGYVCYFLSSFWQIHKSHVWQVMYSSMIVSFAEIGLWQEPKSQKESYETFYNFNDEIKNILSKHTGRKVTNWEAEHSFWNFRKVTAYNKKEQKQKNKSKLNPLKKLLYLH